MRIHSHGIDKSRFSTANRIGDLENTDTGLALDVSYTEPLRSTFVSTRFTYVDTFSNFVVNYVKKKSLSTPPQSGSYIERYWYAAVIGGFSPVIRMY